MTNGRVMWHSSLDSRHSSFLILVSGLFDAANFVAKFGGLLVLFGGNGFLHFAAEADELGLLFGAAGAEFWHLADVARFAMDIEQQRFELGREADVVVRAAEAALLTELQE